MPVVVYAVCYAAISVTLSGSELHSRQKNFWHNRCHLHVLT